jgi:hypothetical protein
MYSFYDNTRRENKYQQPLSDKPSNLGYSCDKSEIFNGVASNPGLVPKGSYGNTPGDCAIDKQSELLFGMPGTSRVKGTKQIFQRPFATTPNLGRGSLDGTDTETHLLHGHATANRKSINTVTDKQFPVFEPLMDEKQEDFTEYTHAVGPFDRGGVPTRMSNKTRVKLSK